MPRYRSYGQLDDPHMSDGDMAFVRMVSRINPEQLQQGDVSYSQNGRMDNDRAWQPRRGLKVFSPALAVGSALVYEFAYTDASPPSYDDSAVNAVYGACYMVDPLTESEYILIATNTKAIAISLADPDTTVDVSYPGGAVIYGQQVEMIQALDKVFLFRGTTGATWEFDGDLSGSPTFAAVESTAYSVSFFDTAANASASDGVVTISETSHGLVDGDIVEVVEDDSSGLAIGDTYEVEKIDDDSFKFWASIADGTYSLVLTEGIPDSKGYIRQPQAAWGVYHQGRLILPYSSTLSTGTTRDEIIFSDIFDPDLYDPVLNQLRFASGSADYIVGVAPLFNDRLIVFCRHSVHLVSGVSGELTDTQVTEITREVGCISRKSITEVGGSILFLSDQGVYSINYGQELNLVANSIPLSEPIENYIRAINWEQANNAIGAYADNRYYLAVPLGGSSVNNAIFVYNFLNLGWESVDTFSDDFDASTVIVAPYRGRNRMFLINDNGAVHLTEESDEFDFYQSYANNTSENPIDGKLITRRHIMGQADIKKFSRATVLAENPKAVIPTNLPSGYQVPGNTGRGGRLDIAYSTTDPDYDSTVIKTVSMDDGEDGNYKASIRKRGYGLQLIFTTPVAKIRGYEVQAITSSRNHIDRE